MTEHSGQSTTEPPELLLDRIDWRTSGLMAFATLIGAVWALYNYTSTGGERGEEQLRPLVWTIFATPFALFLAWALVRRAETWLAAFICFCLYFFTPFVAGRIESLLMTQAEISANKHHTYFVSAMVLHVLAGLAITVWRSSQPVMDAPPTDQDYSAHALEAEQETTY